MAAVGRRQERTDQTISLFNGFVFLVRNSLVFLDTKFFFQELLPLDQSRQPFLRSLVIESAQTLVSLPFTSLAVGKLVGRETPVECRRSGQGRCLCVIFRCTLMVFVFLRVKPGKRCIEVRSIGIVFYAAFA